MTPIGMQVNLIYLGPVLVEHRLMLQLPTQQVSKQHMDITLTINNSLAVSLECL